MTLAFGGENPQRPSTIVESFLHNDADAYQNLRSTFARPLRVLIARICPAHADECVDITLNKTAEAIRVGEVRRDEDLFAFLRKTFRTVVLSFPKDAEEDTTNAYDIPAGGIVQLRKQFSVLTPIHLEALHRYYVLADDPFKICQALSINLEEFESYRSWARHRATLYLELTPSNSRKGVQSRKSSSKRTQAS